LKITHHDAARLQLAGIPGGSAAIVVPFGIALVGALAIAFSWISGAIVPLIVGGLMFVAGTAIAVCSLTRRERLTFDLSARRGRYETRSLVGPAPKPLDFSLDQVAGVELRRGHIQAPGRHPGPGSETWTARLLLLRPRRVVVLAETQGGTEQSVRSIAESVAKTLNVEVLDHAADLVERTRGGNIGTPLARRALADTSFSPPPAGARVALHILAEQQRVELTWKTVGGPALPVMGLLAIGFFALIATVMLMQATGWLPILTWISGAAGPARPAAAGITAALLAMTLLTWALCLGVLQTWRWSSRRLEITPDHVRLIALSPLARLKSLFFGPAATVRWLLPTDEVASVRTHDDALEFRGPSTTHRALIHLPVEGEPAWIAQATRTAIQILGTREP
jgi:hypothetical protein